MLIETMEIRKQDQIYSRVIKNGMGIKGCEGLCCSDRFMVNVDLHTVTAYSSIMCLATYICLSS